ncbi:MAG: hypothetical protein V3T64_14340 [Myxococcota bacterium]
MITIHKRYFSMPVWIAIGIMLAVASCERSPTKSDYVSARVTVICAGKQSEALQACRIGVIKQFSDVSLEELQRRYPKPEPRQRPACGF